MDEGNIRMAAQMYALVAEMEATKIAVEAMKTENASRSLKGESAAWSCDNFFNAAEMIANMAKRLREEI